MPQSVLLGQLSLLDLGPISPELTWSRYSLSRCRRSFSWRSRRSVRPVSPHPSQMPSRPADPMSPDEST